MPRYDYQCKSCETSFVIQASIKDSRDNVVCSACKSSDVYRVFSQVGLTSMPTRGANSLSKSSSSSSGSDSSSSSTSSDSSATSSSDS